MESEQTQGGGRHQRKQAIARLISGLVSGKGELNEAAIIAAHPELMPELQIELRKLKSARAGETAAVVGVTMMPPANGSVGGFDQTTPEEPAIQIKGYTLQNELGRGGQAVVYLAVQQNTGRRVAIKVMRPEALADERALARFKREVQVLAALDHPNIVGIVDTGVTASGSHFIIMSYVAGSPLDEYMKPRRSGSPDAAKLLRLFLKICAAVNVAHVRGIVHRDLKPGNIRIDERGEPHILDFGLAHTPLDRLAGGEHPIAVTGEFLGSLPWSSPEQAEGDPDRIDMRTDVYSLGVILYQILTEGRFPYDVVGNIRDVLNNILNAEPMPPSKVAAIGSSSRVSGERRPGKLGPPPVNETMERIVLKALSKNRELRYQSAGELGRDVAQYLSGQQTAARQPEPVAAATAQPPVRKSFGLLPVILLVVVVLGIGAGGAWIFLRKPAPPARALSAAPEIASVPVANISSPPVAVATTAPIVAPPAPEAMPAFGLANSHTIAVLGGTCHRDGDALALTSERTQCIVYFGALNLANYSLAFEVKTNAIGAGKGIRVIVHAFERSSCQFWFSDYDNTMMELSGRAAGVTQRMEMKAYRLEPDRWYQVRVDVHGPEVQCYIDGQKCLSGTDERVTRGRIGVATFNDAARFRNIKITSSNGMILWEGPPDLSTLPANEVDKVSSEPVPDLHKTDLLKAFDPATGVLAGSWNMTGDGLDGQGAGAQIQFTSAVPAEYDYRISFVRLKGNGPIALVGSQQGHPFAWVIGGHEGTMTGFGLVGGKNYDVNDTLRRSTQWISNGLEHTLVVRVRKDLISGYIDGLQKDNLIGEMNNLTLPSDFSQTNSPSLGLRLGGDEVVVKSADMFELSPKSATTAPGER